MSRTPNEIATEAQEIVDDAKDKSVPVPKGKLEPLFVEFMAAVAGLIPDDVQTAEPAKKKAKA